MTEPKQQKEEKNMSRRRKYKAKTYYDAFIINGELYVLNPKESGKVECITSETPTGEELLKIEDAIDRAREERETWFEAEMSELKRVQELIKEASSKVISAEQSTQSTVEFLKMIKKDMYYGQRF